MRPPDARTRQLPGGGRGVAQFASCGTQHYKNTAPASTTYSLDLADEILIGLEGVAVVLAGAAMSITPLTTGECASLLKMIDKAQHLIAVTIGGAE